MHSLLEETRPADAALVTHKLRLIWKDPETRRYHQVGQFEALSDGRYAFGYLPGASDLSGFDALLEFPDLRRIYMSDEMPSFLANRVMSDKRPSYAQHLGWLGLGKDATPVEILARTGGPRETDTFHVVDSFEPQGGFCRGRFFVSGIRHQAFSPQDLEVNQELQLRDEPDNVHNPRAILLTAEGDAIGWIPDWLVEDIHDFRRTSSQINIFVEQVNADAPPHLAVRCRLEVRQGAR